MEGINASSSVADLQIKVEIDPNDADKHPGFLCADTVRATVLDVNVMIEEIASKPDNSIALNNIYEYQEDPIEVIRSWKVRYEGSISSALISSADIPVKWQRRTHGSSDDWVTFGTMEVFENKENNTGDFDIRFVPGNCVTNCKREDVRRLKVINVVSESFSLKAGSDYKKKNQNQIIWPKDYGIKMSGKVSKKSGPEVDKIKWGFIQGISSPTGSYVQVEWQLDKWYWLIDPGKVGHAMYYEKVIIGVNADPTQKFNDAPPNSYLYHGSSGFTLGYSNSDKDTPGRVSDMILVTFEDSNGTDTAWGTFNYDVSKYKYLHDFTVWQVVFNNETDQYVPLKQRNWYLYIDGSHGNTWKCATDLFTYDAYIKPTDGSVTSSNNMMKNSEKNHKTINNPNQPPK